MRVRIEVTETPAASRAAWQTAGSPAWTVTARNLATKAPIADAAGNPIVRLLGSVGAAPLPAFPLPPQPEVPAAARSAAPAATLAFSLVTAANTTALEGLLTQFITKTLVDDEVDAFGRYLFDTLIGDTLWRAIDTAAGNNWIDLVVAVPDTAVELSRLPWELVRNDAGFLALSAKLSVAREVVSGAALTAVDRTPRVLFVVGTELTDGRVRPGAEYLQIVRGLRARQFNLKTKLVSRATAKLVAAAVDEFRPDIVHFIGHGAVDPTYGAYIELLDDANPANPKAAFADAVTQMLTGAGAVPMPSMVVLSACYTAVTKVTQAAAGEIAASGVSRFGQVATPLAGHLITQGVPLVVAMSGSVSDQASRLFTRQFYESVAGERDVVQATALGRRAAIRDGGADPRSSVDWAFPTIFVSSAVQEPRLQLSPVKGSHAFARSARWRKLAEQWPYGVPPLFCDRFDVLERFDLLLSDLAMQQAQTGFTKLLSVLAVAVVEPEVPPNKFGRSWLLRELAAKAYADGHLPILLTGPPTSAPTSFNELLGRIIDSTDEVLAQLDLPDEGFELVSMLKNTPAGQTFPAGVNVPAEIARRSADRDENAYARALRNDLLRILEKVRTECRPPDEAAKCRLVLLVDDVHRMAMAAQSFLQNLIGKVGLSTAGQDIRVVFTWSLPPKSSEPAAGQQHAIDAVKNWLQDQHDLALMYIGKFGRRMSLTPAAGAEKESMQREQQLAYEYYLMHRSLPGEKWRGLSSRRGAGGATLFWDTYSRLVRGVPSLLEEETAKVFEEPLPESLRQLFQGANDEDWLQLANQETRP